MVKKPELLAPAGDMERLEMALHYGADAVYLAGRQYGMRASAGNFSPEEMRRAVSTAHGLGRKVYVTCNTLPREDELAGLPAWLEQLRDMGADALIVADLGVIALAKKYAPEVPLHVSTQLGVVNSAAASMLWDMGVTRVVLARELSMDEIASLRAHSPAGLEIEAFVHGAMCVSFSGRCTLSNYLTGRDANRGACAQPCRWKYHLMEEKRPGEYFEISEDGGTYILNSRDMCMIDHIPELIAAGVDSFKIEGRMKSAYYAAAVTNAYRHGIDAAAEGRPLEDAWRREVDMVSHREYSTGFYFGQPGQYTKDGLYFTGADVCAVVEGEGENGLTRLTQRNKFARGDKLELLTPDSEPVSFTADEIYNAQMEKIESTPHPMMEIFMPLPGAPKRLSILRKIRDQ
ncbi:MAG: peptidase U32 family protein [Candidatus Heteroscillospira sp.]|jgi:putative protease